MRWFFMVAAIAAACSILATPAGAKPGTKARQLQAALVHHQLVRYYHSTGYIRSIGRVAHRTIYSPNPRTRHRWVSAVRWLMRVRHDARVKIEALRAPPQPAIAHLALWNCITNGAYPGAAHEGDGYNGPYSGPLGMTTPWEGHMPPGRDWVHSDRQAVYAIAESEYAAHGYSTSWLEHQWPNTSPPCIR